MRQLLSKLRNMSPSERAQALRERGDDGPIYQDDGAARP